jgi:hypothetical protein
MRPGDLLKRKPAPHVNGEWYAIAITVNEFYVRFIWARSGEIDGCAKRLMEVIK